jgi:hypothetical protein
MNGRATIYQSITKPATSGTQDQTNRLIREPAIVYGLSSMVGIPMVLYNIYPYGNKDIARG